MPPLSGAGLSATPPPAPRWGFSSTAATLTGSPRELRGSEFDLTVAETSVNFSGARVTYQVNGSDGTSVYLDVSGSMEANGKIDALNESMTVAVSDRARELQPKLARVPGISLLHGTTLGIVGLGEIGREVAIRAAAFGMNVGDVSGVVETDFGYHLILRTEPEPQIRADTAKVKSILGTDCPACENIIFGQFRPNLTGCPNHTAKTRKNTDRCFRKTHRTGWSRDNRLASQSQLTATAERKPIQYSYGSLG